MTTFLNGQFIAIILKTVLPKEFMVVEVVMDSLPKSPIFLGITNWIFSNYHPCLAYHLVLKIHVVAGFFALAVGLTIDG
jgi:subtilase family serine protease